MGWIISNISLIGELTLNHVLLSIPPILIGFVAAVPLGWLASRWKPWRSIIVGGGSLLYTIPSLPLFVILPYLLGTRITDPVNIVVALTIYAVAVMVRSASDAFASVPTDAIESATAVGYSRVVAVLGGRTPAGRSRPAGGDAEWSRRAPSPWSRLERSSVPRTSVTCSPTACSANSSKRSWSASSRAC